MDNKTADEIIARERATAARRNAQKNGTTVEAELARLGPVAEGAEKVYEKRKPSWAGISNEEALRLKLRPFIPNSEVKKDV